MIVWFPDSAQLTHPTHTSGKGSYRPDSVLCSIHIFVFVSSVLPRLSLATPSRDYSSRAARLGFPVVCLCCASEHNTPPPSWALDQIIGPACLPPLVLSFLLAGQLVNQMSKPIEDSPSLSYNHINLGFVYATLLGFNEQVISQMMLGNSGPLL
ncbi:hypothetical protein DSO57_1015991 [Entomophthora muscae]|uniref:Uncharacterized protein n=1 Tax=Entomophthora muscae TaxID=34485 RepID=A0ACC2SUD8_9FUNG|nr:hypothetical protein DSO57_1015991 [Entomophthora muscae]